MKLQALVLSIQAGIDGMRANRLRTALSTLGVVIGVASLVAVLSLGDGMERYVRDSIGKERVQVVRVSPRFSREVDGRRVAVPNVVRMTAADLAQVRRIPGVADVDLWLAGATTFRFDGREVNQVKTVGTLENGVEFESLEMQEGRFFVYAESVRDAAVVVVSSKLAEKLAGSRPPASLLEGRVWVGGAPRRVVGIYKDEESSAYIPLRGASKVIGGARSIPPQLLVRAASIESVEAVRARLEDWAATRFGPPDEVLEFSTYASRIEQATQGIAVFKLVMSAIIGISLLVGGIGVMNVLLASVAERTREIGVRRALGAPRRAILAQFLFESMAMTGMGSMVGIVVGSAGAMAMSPFVHNMTGQAIRVSPNIGTLLVAVLCPAVVGLVFGIYPAHLAARLSPIEALRHE